MNFPSDRTKLQTIEVGTASSNATAIHRAAGHPELIHTFDGILNLWDSFE